MTSRLGLLSQRCGSTRLAYQTSGQHLPLSKVDGVFGLAVNQVVAPVAQFENAFQVR
jgi:hypothetical protein